MIERNNLNYLTSETVNEYISKFDKFEWNKEPVDSWKEICKKRAQQLRDSYDYIILYYSGGSDTTTVLNAFLDNNIHIDEIVTTIFDKLNEPCLDGKKAEADLIKKGYNGLYTKVILSYNDIYNFLKNDNCLSNNPNFTGQLHSFARFNINHLTKFGFTKDIVRKSKICHLIGEQDPNVIFLDGHYYANIHMKRYCVAENFHENTAFFTSFDFPDIHIKQCHIVANYMKTYTQLDQNILNNRICKLVVRDYYSPLISPQKHLDNPLFSLQNYHIYSEGNLLLKKYLSHDSSFKDLYYSASIKQQVNIAKQIKSVDIQYYKKYLLF